MSLDQPRGGRLITDEEGAAEREAIRTEPSATPPQRPAHNLPAFPVHALPASVAAYVSELSDSLEVSRDMSAAFVLGALSASLLGKLLVCPKPDWREPPILYVCVVAGAGQRKSPVLKAVLAPLYKIESEEHERWLLECAQVAEQNEERPKTEKALSRPARSRLIAGDVTPEKLAELTAESRDNRVALFSDESSVFDMASGLYGPAPNLDVYLKGWDCSPLIVDRKGGGSLFVKSPSLAMVQCAQPSVFASLAKRPELRGKGLIPRFLISVPPSNRGFREHDHPPVDPQTRAAWSDLVSSLYYWAPNVNGEPRVVPYDRLAREECLGFQRWLERLIAPGAQYDEVGDMADKIVGAMVRISLILWAAESSQEEREDPHAEISGSTVRRAIEIARYFLRHNEYALTKLLGTTPNDGAADTLWKWIQSKGKVDLVIDRAFRQYGPGSLRGSKEKATAAANVLVDRGALERTATGWVVVGKAGSR